MQQHFIILSCLLNVAIILNRIHFSQTDCNVCNAITNTACVSETEYQQCDENKPFGDIYSCNRGFYCSVLGGCSRDENAKDCQDCKKCSADKRFACLDTKTFALCLGQDVYSDIIAECGEGLACNIKSPFICDTDSPTCSHRDDPTTVPPTTTTTTTTISPAQDPNAFCRLYQEEGRFPVGIDPQTTCRQYVHCVKIGDVWYGPVYNCPGMTYYDSVQKRCVTQKPPICRGTVARLMYRNIFLE